MPDVKQVEAPVCKHDSLPAAAPSKDLGRQLRDTEQFQIFGHSSLRFSTPLPVQKKQVIRLKSGWSIGGQDLS